MRSVFSLSIKWILALCVLSAGTGVRHGHAAISGKQDYSFVQYDVDGNKSRSFYPEFEMEYLHTGDVRFNERIEALAADLEGNVNYRVTSDRVIEKRDDFSPQRMYLDLKAQDRLIRGGDVYVRMSDLTLDTRAKGAKVELGAAGHSRAILAGGISASQWDDLWEKASDKSVKRSYLWGGRLETRFFGADLPVNLNYGYKKDDPAFFSSHSDPALVNVMSVDGEWRANEDLRFFYEVAHSYLDPDIRENTEAVKDDGAVRAGMNLKFGDYDIKADYRRTQPHFRNAGGYTSPDLESLKLDALWRLPEKVKLQHYLRADRDNLSKLLSRTTMQINPGFKLSCDLPLGIRTNAGADVRKRYSSDKYKNEKTIVYSSDFRKDLDGVDLYFRYVRTIVDDKVSPGREKAGDTYSARINGKAGLGSCKVNWSVGEDIHHDNFIAASHSDMRFSTSVGLKFRWPSVVDVDSSFRFGNFNAYTDTSDSNKTDYRVGITYHVRKNTDLKVSYERKSYNHAEATRNYADTVFKGGMDLRF